MWVWGGAGRGIDIVGGKGAAAPGYGELLIVELLRCPREEKVRPWTIGGADVER